MSIPQNLRQLRTERGLTQEQVAQQVGVTRQAISSYESGRTRPDIDTLMRLCDVYGTDLDGILYGKTQALADLRLIKRTAVILAAVLALLTAASSACLWVADRFFAIQPGPLTAEEKAVFEIRRRLSTAWETLDGLILALALLGGLLLLILLLTRKCTIPIKPRLVYLAAVAAALLLIAALFGFTNGHVQPVNYLITPFLVIGRMAFFLIVSLISGFLKNRRHRTL